MDSLPQKLISKLDSREAEGNLRTLKKGSGLDFCSNDYLGLAGNSSIGEQASQLLENYPESGIGATGSRLLTGNHPLAEEIESFLQEEYRIGGALLFNSGYAANLGLLASVPQRGDVVFYDEYVHASIREGLRLNRAQNFKFRHNDLEDLQKKFSQQKTKNPESTFYLITESVFSMDGDSPDLVAMTGWCKKNMVLLIVDEAHSFGIDGKEGHGMVSKLALSDKVFARIITFGKAAGAHGAAVLGSAALRSYLLNFASSLIYTTALPAHTLAHIQIALKKVLLNSRHEREALSGLIRYFNQEVRVLKLSQYFLTSDSPIHSCIVPGNEAVQRLSSHLQEKGILVHPIMSPTVPKGSERLRICLHSFTQKKDVKRLLTILSEHFKTN